jgi:hypothetical protein
MDDGNRIDKPTSGTSTTNVPKCSCKVGKIARDYNIEDIDADLARRWRGDGVKRQSLRAITTYFNTRVFRDELEKSDLDILESQVRHFYEILTGDTATKGEVVEVTNRLRRAGIDVTTMQRERFVSYQTIHNHLRECLNITPPTKREKNTTPEDDQENLRALRTRIERIAESMIDRNLEDSDSESFTVRGSVMAQCDDCGYNKPVTTLLDDDGCYCEDQNSPE